MPPQCGQPMISKLIRTVFYYVSGGRSAQTGVRPRSLMARELDAYLQNRSVDNSGDASPDIILNQLIKRTSTYGSIEL